jgi:ABC-type thiamine transport system substrate-binding protein
VLDRFRIIATLLFAIGAGFWLASFPANAQDLRAKAEAEGKLMMYATFTAADAKTLLDGFKQAYPKIDATYYRSNDAALMERFLNENRAGQNLCDVIVTTSFYGQNIKKQGLFAPYDSPERKFFREGYKDPQAQWTSTYTNYGAFGYNMRTVAKTSVPKSFDDLLKPEWKGQITMEGSAGDKRAKRAVSGFEFRFNASRRAPPLRTGCGEAFCGSGAKSSGEEVRAQGGRSHEGQARERQ